MYLNFGKRNTNSKSSRMTPEVSKKTTLLRGLHLHNASGSTSSRRTNTVQTVAGPLLASTRFNTFLDPSTYTNVNSPGFTGRLVQCALNGQRNKHDSPERCRIPHSNPGRFPSAHQLQRQLSSSVLSPNREVGRTPVRIRIAPPSDREHKHDLGKIHSLSNGDAPFKKSPEKEETAELVLENQQESSRKRIYSQCLETGLEDLHNKKRQRKSEIPLPNPNSGIYHYQHVRAPSPRADCTQQSKRAREKGSPEEQKRQRRRTITPNNAILSSLSSSRNLLERLAAQKRKSVNSPRSISPVDSPEQRPKENRIASKARGVQCNLDLAKNNISETPIKPLVNAGSNSNSMERLEISVKVACSEESPPKTPSSSDHACKLFRKEVSASLPRTPTFKDRKSSFWAQLPMADDLSCTLPSDGSKLDRPERFQSLLACVRGKDPKPEEIKSQDSANISTASTPQIAPVSPGAAHTVTVSSTSTIMTCATVTSVSGALMGSAAEKCRKSSTLVDAGQTPQLVPLSPAVVAVTSSSALSDNAAVLLPLSTSASSVSSGYKPSPISFGGGPSTLNSGSENILSGVNTVASASPSNSSSNASSVSSISGSTGSRIVQANPSFLVGVPAVSFGGTNALAPKGSDLSAISSETSVGPAVLSSSTTASSQRFPSAVSESNKPVFQLGSGASGPSVTEANKTAFNFLSNASEETKPVLQFGSSSSDASQSAFQISSSSKPTFSFGQNSSEVSKPVFGASTEIPCKPTDSVGPIRADPFKLVFGASAVETSKSTLSLGTISVDACKQAFVVSTNKPSKPIFSFGQNSAEASEPVFRASTEIPSKPTLFQGTNCADAFKGVFGVSAAETSKPTLSLGPNPAEACKSVFGVSTVEPTKPTFSFGPSSEAGRSFGSMSGESLKPSFGARTTESHTPFSFGSGSTEAPKTTFGMNPVESPKPSFPFGYSPANAPKPTVARGSFESPKPSFSLVSNSSETPRPTFGSNGVQASMPSFSFGKSSTSGLGSSAMQPSPFGSSLPTSSKPDFQNGAKSSTPTFQFGSGSSGMSSSTVLSSISSKSSFSSSGFAKDQQSTQGGFAFGPAVQTTPSVPNAGSFNWNQASNPFGSSSTTSFGSSTSTLSPAFGAAAPSPDTFGTSVPNQSSGTSVHLGFGCSGPSSTVSSAPTNTFKFDAGNTVNPVMSYTQSGHAGNPFMFGQKQETSIPTQQFGGTQSSSQTSQSSGLFSIGSGSAPQQRRIREVRRRR